MSVRVLVIALVVQLALAVAFVIMAINGFPVLRDLFGPTQSHTATGLSHTATGQSHTATGQSHTATGQSHTATGRIDSTPASTGTAR
jgi:hypothetical protein